MNNKHTEKKTKEKNAIVSKEASLVEKCLDLGDFLVARRGAHAILRSTDSRDQDRAMAERALRVTWPDPVALLVGVLCMAFSVTVTFLVAY